MMFTNSIIAASAFISMVSAHGIVVSPPVRAAGPAMNATCGKAVTAIVVGDPTSHVEGLPEAAATDPGFNSSACNLMLCKGLQFADNVKNVQKFTAGQVVNIKADITIPHEGPANVSVIRTSNNTIIGKSMISFAVYADDAVETLPANNTNFNITMPTDLGNGCAVAGACVVQWFWVGTEAEQTYESCMDFTMVGKSSLATGANSTASSTRPSTTGSASAAMSMSAGMPMRRTGALRRAQGAASHFKKRHV